MPDQPRTDNPARCRNLMETMVSDSCAAARPVEDTHQCDHYDAGYGDAMEAHRAGLDAALERLDEARACIAAVEALCAEADRAQPKYTAHLRWMLPTGRVRAALSGDPNA